VKFGKYVTGSVVKVSEKFGFNWSIFGWFGHFTEHLACGELGFGRSWGQLNTFRNLDSQDFEKWTKGGN
jgi:hypothetical protein